MTELNNIKAYYASCRKARISRIRKRQGHAGHNCHTFRSIEHYKQSLPDRYYEKALREMGVTGRFYHTPNAWDLEPDRSKSGCWKDQSRKKHQYIHERSGWVDKEPDKRTLPDITERISDDR